MVKIAAMGLALMMLSGCLATTAQDKTPDSGIDGSFAPALSQQYQTMAALFDVNGRTETARQFKARASAANRGRWAQPEAVPENAGSTAQVEGREALMLGLTQVMNAENALWLARAQVNYECWVMIGEETCQQDFDKAMQGLTIPAESMQTQSVYFDPDSSKLSPETHATLTGIANMVRMNKMVNIRLVGSTDHLNRNASLALRRGIAVRNVLAQMGLSPERITVEGEDHSDTILSKQMRENPDETEKRRVDIILEPAFGALETETGLEPVAVVVP